MVIAFVGVFRGSNGWGMNWIAEKELKDLEKFWFKFVMFYFGFALELGNLLAFVYIRV